MIFYKTWQQVLDGTKTQTRRPRKENQLAIGGIPPLNPFDLERVEIVGEIGQDWIKAKLLWEVGRTYAIQPGRGKHSLGRLLLNRIRLEHVQSISCDDLRAEGLKTELRKIDATMDLLRQWEELWNGMYARTEFAYENNPQVWVLGFELVETYEDRIKAISGVEWRKLHGMKRRDQIFVDCRE